MYEQFEAGYTANRFRSSADWFIASETAAVHIIRIGAAGERAVDLLHALSAHLPADVNVAIESVRGPASWSGHQCSRNETRETLARLKLLLATYGGVEFAVFTSNDQLTLTPELEVVIYSRGDAWPARLRALGLEQREVAPAAVWRPNREALREAPELDDALLAAARRLKLEPVASEL